MPGSSFDQRKALVPGSPEEHEQDSLSAFRCVSRLFQFYSDHPSILPVYVRELNTVRCPALAVDFLADIWNSSRRVLGKPLVDSVLDQILNDGWETVDQQIQLNLGAEWVRCDLLGVYAGVCNAKARQDSAPKQPYVRCGESVKTTHLLAEIEAEALLADVAPEDMQEVPVQGDEVQLDYFGDDEEQAA